MTRFALLEIVLAALVGLVVARLTNDEYNRGYVAGMTAAKETIAVERALELDPMPIAKIGVYNGTI